MKRKNDGQKDNGHKRQKTSQYSQKRVSMVLAQPNRAITAPRAQSKTMRNDFTVSSGSKRGSLRIRGQDWLGRVTVPNGAVPGQAILEVYINPLELTGTRLALFAQMYDKYRFHKIRFEFVPCASTTARGSLIMAYDRDISDATPPANDSGIRQYMSFQDSVAGPVWGPLECDCPLSHPEEGLFSNPVAGGDDRLAYQGQFYVALMEVPQVSESIGDIYIHFDCEFFDPQLDTQVPQLYGAAQAGQVYFGPATNDALRSFVAAGAGVISALSNKSLRPVLDPVTGRAFLDLAQGIYRIYSSLMAGQPAGAISFAPPTVVPNVPRPNPAPQPSIVNTSTVDATCVAPGPGLTPNVGIQDFTVTVPPGGAKVYVTYDDVTGFLNSAGVSLQELKIDQLARYWADGATLL